MENLQFKIANGVWKGVFFLILVGWLVGSHLGLLHFTWSFTSILFNPYSLISFFTSWFRVILGFSLPLTSSTSYNILFSTHSPSSFCNTFPSHLNLCYQFNPHYLPQLYTRYLISRRHTAHPSQHSHLCPLKSSYLFSIHTPTCFEYWYGTFADNRAYTFVNLDHNIFSNAFFISKVRTS